MSTETEVILDKLNEIKSELDYIKEHIADVDVVLTDDDSESLKQAEIELAKGKTKRL